MTFTVKEKSYSLKRDITFGEYRTINKINKKLSDLSEKFGSDDISKLEDKDLISLSQEFASTNDEQLEIIVNFLESLLGLTQEDINKMALDEAVQLFQEAFKEATTVKKNSSKISP